MFSTDKWREIFLTISKNKLRTFLTAFSVAWGIFMLIILLGAGQGLQNGVISKFNSDATNSLSIVAGVTGKEFRGRKEGRRISFTNRDYFETLRLNSDNIEYISAKVLIWSNSLISYEKESVSYNVQGVHPDADEIECSNIIRGRFIDRIDIENNKKSAVLSEKIRKELFGDKQAIGEWIDIGGIMFKVVGIYNESSDQENDRVYIPLSTAQKSYGLNNSIYSVWFTVKGLDVAQTVELENKVRSQFAQRHTFSPTDVGAIHLYNNLKQFQNITNLFAAISGFLWLIGIGTIIAGIVGVSNIMLIIVKERTKEIGIRKAIGAKPKSIVNDIFMESIFITTTAGYFGLVFGVVVLELYSLLAPPSDFFTNPQANIKIAVGATILLVICGTIAGLIPAHRAASIKPVVALRDE